LLGDIPGATCTQGSGTGLVGIEVTDCDNTLITDTANIMLSVTQNGSAAGQTPIDIGKVVSGAGLTGLAGLNGLFLVCDVPAGTTTLDATYMSKKFLTNTITVVGSDATEAVLRPGY